jgi:ZIP family zinc transporter
MALGTGVLIGSVSFELVEEALKTRRIGWVALLMLCGAVVFTIGDWLLARHGAATRKNPEQAGADGQPMAIVLGSALDAVPESFVLGLTVLQGAVSPSLFAGIVLSNLPEGMASSSGLKAANWPERRVMLMWLAVVVVSGVTAAAGYAVLDPAAGLTGALAQAFAAGALLAMLADTLLPEAYAIQGVVTGLLVVVGYAIAVALSSF